MTKPRAPDGGWGWVVVFAYFCISVASDGVRYSFGVMFISLLEAFGRGKGETAWVGGLMAGMSNFVGPLATKMTDRFGCRPVAIAGSVLASAGLLFSVFAQKLYHLYITLGIMTGCGYGMIFLTSVVSISRYFDKRRALAMGISVCGSGIGAIIFNPVSKWLLDEYGWRGTLLIEAGLVLNCVAFSALYRPLSGGISKSELAEVHEEDGILLESVNDAIKITSMNDRNPEITSRKATIDIYKRDVIYDKEEREIQAGKTNQDMNEMSIFLQSNQEKVIELSPDLNEHKLKQCLLSCRELLRFSLLKDPSFLVFLTSGFLIALAYNTPYTHLPDLATDIGYTKSEGVLLISYLGIANTISRVLFGILGDSPKVNRAYLYSITNMVCGVVTAFVVLFDKYGLLVLYAVVNGVTSGGSVSLSTLVAGDLFSVEVITESVGLFMLACGIANCIGTLLAGWFFDITGSYAVTFLTTGVVLILSGSILFIIPCLRRRKCKT